MNKIIVPILICFTVVLQAQNNQPLRIGEWQSHFAYNESFSVFSAKNQIIGATKLGLITIEKSNSDYLINTITKANGLSGYNITALYHDSHNNSTIIGYNDGNIDILKNGKTYNINDLRIKQMQGNKQINSFLTIGDRLFCATNFGILVINTNDNEVESTYYIGNEASNLVINQLTTDNEYLYAATAQGVKRAKLDARDIHIYQSWETISNDEANYNSIVEFNGTIVTAKGEKGNANSIYYLQNNELINFSTIINFQDLGVFNNQLMTLSSTEIEIFNQSFQPIDKYSNPSDISPQFKAIAIQNSNEIWIADNSNGIVRLNVEHQSWSRFLPPGPTTNQAYKINMSGNDLWVVPGGITAYWNNLNTPGEVSILSDTGWSYIQRSNTPLFRENYSNNRDPRDLMDIIPNPQKPDNVFVTSWGNGLLEYDKIDNKIIAINAFQQEENGLTPPEAVGSSSERLIRVSAAAFDQNNVLWMSNSNAYNGIVAYFPEDGTWKRYSYETTYNNHGMAPILVTSSGHKWLSIQRGREKGLFVWDDNNTPKNQNDDKYRGPIPPSMENDNRNQGQLLLWDEEGIEITDQIYAMVEDHSGHIWLGTDKGIVVQYQPNTIFTREKPVFSRILIARGDGTNYADYLLDNQTVSTIAIDPGNQKWIGTQGAGAFLVSPNGTEEIYAFNTANSPLPSNFINSITIKEETGEVFFATSEGIVSFKGGATKSRVDYSDMYAFPNPVRPDFSGDITITGLVANTIVKITDTAGNLVYETKSIGGQAFWNGRNLWGKPVKSGIYLIFVASQDGNKSGVTKIAIVR